VIKPGDIVVFDELPRWVSQLTAASQAVFRHCLGRPYRVVEIDEQGLAVLDVSGDVDVAFGGRFNDLRLEQELVRKVAQ